jgi:hypothetical protein
MTIREKHGHLRRRTPLTRGWVVGLSCVVGSDAFCSVSLALMDRWTCHSLVIENFGGASNTNTLEWRRPSGAG